MDTKELNDYIKNYLEHDKTQRAIMITAPWGSGKSYYIKNNLCAFLHENNLGYAIVSLYGIKELKDISKNLYLEIRANALTKKSEKLAVAKMAGKTILKGVAGLIGIDLSQSEEDMQKLYESIDLSNKLIIFEDIERTSIDISEFLGYVNNLVEQDGVKVLLVANENEIIQYEAVDNDKSEQRLTDDSKKYLKIKEKTICDTIKFTSNYYESIKSILEKFDNKYFKLLLQEKDENGDLSLVRRIKQQMISEKCMNYRSLLFACQKMEDMLNLLDKNKEYNLEFIENLFIGTIIYSIKLNSGNKNVWEDVEYTSNQLGNYKFPLYKIMYDFINMQYFSIEDFEFMQDLFEKTKDISKADETLQVIYSYYIMSESEVKNAIDLICERLEKDEGIVHNEYVRIANYLVAIRSTINYKIDDCLKYMLENIKKAVNKGEEVRVYSSSGIQLINQEQIDDFEEFKRNMQTIVDNRKDNFINFDLDSDSNKNVFSEYYYRILKNKINFLDKKGFANKLDINNLLERLKISSSNEICSFRRILQSVYMNISNISNFFYDDINSLIQIKNGVSDIISNPGNLDKIQLLQLSWLLDDIKDYIKKLQR